MKSLESLVADLESIVDSSSVSAVLEALSEICHLKADHIQHDWQDTELSAAWTRAGLECNRACDRVRRKAQV